MRELLTHRPRPSRLNGGVVARRLTVAAFATVGLLLTARPAFSAPPTAPTAAMLAPVQRWIDAFNVAQTLPEDVFTDDVVITDQFPPYAWSGKVGMHAWSSDVASGLRDPRIKAEHVATGSPRAFMMNLSGSRATFVLPATLTYTLDGKPRTDRALWLFVVVKNGEEWRIAADTWTRTDE